MFLKLIRRSLLVIFVLSLLCGTAVPEAEAIDPVTIAILAPIALKVAEKAYPYVIKGLSSGGKQLLKMGGATLKILYLPLGILEVTLGIPFGRFSKGLVHLFKGIIAPGELVLHTLLFPLALFGVNISG